MIIINNHLRHPGCENSSRLNMMNLTLRQRDNNNARMNCSYNLIWSEEKIRGIPQGDGIEFEDIKPLTPSFFVWSSSQAQPTLLTQQALPATMDYTW